MEPRFGRNPRQGYEAAYSEPDRRETLVREQREEWQEPHRIPGKDVRSSKGEQQKGNAPCLCRLRRIAGPGEPPDQEDERGQERGVDDAPKDRAKARPSHRPTEGL